MNQVSNYSADSITQRIGEIGVVPVIAIDDASKAAQLAKTLMAAGLPIAEITFRTSAAADVINAMRSAEPEMLVGAGTLLSTEDLDAAVDAGAQFGLAPGLVPQIVERAKECGLPFYPGVMTPSDIGTALSLGIDTMKFFPAGPAGGPAMLKALAAPHAHRAPRFVPTGGIRADDIPSWLNTEGVAAIGGSWIASRSDIADNRWQSIHDNAASAVARAREVRS
ncbi:bifunctional 4-hydroxy-2-oxoglutarate aldolase/2-dehydro-3-deoxy-phosphogluconate aldolase [Salinisphaera hydrothermalis]|uniref:bifunctional 4-hydroxy-2-oxoglutarate aldolase/2-dehydro-3-deoxy-phosphogluconate aldolase n=1 Tax=Salinisphaera hydrothermalis TaxID=563188 RepID=UPI00333F82B9